MKFKSKQTIVNATTGNRYVVCAVPSAEFLLETGRSPFYSFQAEEGAGKRPTPEHPMLYRSQGEVETHFISEEEWDNQINDDTTFFVTEKKYTVK